MSEGAAEDIRVLLVDDHALVRAGFRMLLGQASGITVVGEASTGHEALRLVETLLPDVVLMDISMPGLNGLEAVRRIAGQFPQVRVVILSMHANEEYVRQALRSGASGYLLKDAATAELELAVRAVQQGHTYLSPQISRQVVEEYLQQEGEPLSSPFELLTARQREVLQLIAEGHTTRQIAQLLGLSVKTVETHRQQLMDRLGIYDVPGLVRYAIRTGLVPPE